MLAAAAIAAMVSAGAPCSMMSDSAVAAMASDCWVRWSSRVCCQLSTTLASLPTLCSMDVTECNRPSGNSISKGPSTRAATGALDRQGGLAFWSGTARPVVPYCAASGGCPAASMGGFQLVLAAQHLQSPCGFPLLSLFPSGLWKPCGIDRRGARNRDGPDRSADDGRQRCLAGSLIQRTSDPNSA